MEKDSNGSNGRRRYASCTRERIGCMVETLRTIQIDYINRVDAVLLELRGQEDASRQMGFEDASLVCLDMADQLGQMRYHHWPKLNEIIAGLLEKCRAIQRHAEGLVDEEVPSGDSDAQDGVGAAAGAPAASPSAPGPNVPPGDGPFSRILEFHDGHETAARGPRTRANGDPAAVPRSAGGVA